VNPIPFIPFPLIRGRGKIIEEGYALLNTRDYYIKGRLKGLRPFKNNLPPLLTKERGIQGVRLINNLGFDGDFHLQFFAPSAIP